MAILLVTYDLNKEPTSKEYQGILGVIKAEGVWARLSESSYAMDTQMSPQQVYEKMKPYLDNDDHLLVITLKQPYYGQHSKDVIDWLDSKLSY